MPVSKKTKDSSKKTTSIKKTISKKEENKPSKGGPSKKEKISNSRAVRTPSSSKAKSIIVDVIEDDVNFNEPEKSSLGDFLDSSLLNFKNNKTKIESFSGRAAEDLDSQKKFFKELRDETKVSVRAGEGLETQGQGIQDQEVRDLLDLFEDEDLGPKKKRNSHNSRRLNLYSHFVWKFLLIVFLLIVFVGYFSFSKLTIDIVPKNEMINESLLLKISNDSGGIRLLSDASENISGFIKEIPISLSSNFSSSGEEFIGEDISGRVKIINNYSRNQPLIATTRLWTPDGKEFKIKEAVNVPAGGEVWVDIYVEKPRRDLAISATTFTIPGLWVGLQDMIYAKSEEGFIFEQKKEKYVRASDLAAARQEIENNLLKELLVKAEVEKKNLELESGKKFTYVYFQETETIIKADAKAEDKKEAFNVKADANFKLVFFVKEEAEKLAYGKLNLLVPSGKELMDFNPENIIYSFFSADDNAVTIKSTFGAKMVLKTEAEVVKKDNLVNLNAEQLSSYLSSQPEVKSFSLKFQPRFIKTAPRLVDRIKINLVEDLN